MRIGGEDHVHVPVKSRARIPAGALRLVFQTYRQSVHALMDIRRGIEVERVVAVRPIACLLPVYPDTCVAHGPVEDEAAPASAAQVRNFEFSPVPPCPRERKASRASCMFHGFGLAVLHDGHMLPVVPFAERPVDGPVMRHRDALPC